MKRLLLATLALGLFGTDVIEYDLDQQSQGELRQAYDAVIEAKADYDAALKQLKESVKAVDEKLVEIKSKYGAGDRRKVVVKGDKVEVQIAARDLDSGTFTLSAGVNDDSLTFGNNIWSSDAIVNATAQGFTTTDLELVP